MLSLLPTTRVFVCTHPTDMRKGFDSLAALVKEQVQKSCGVTLEEEVRVVGEG